MRLNLSSRSRRVEAQGSSIALNALDFDGGQK